MQRRCFYYSSDLWEGAIFHTAWTLLDAARAEALGYKIITITFAFSHPDSARLNFIWSSAVCGIKHSFDQVVRVPQLYGNLIVFQTLYVMIGDIAYFDPKKCD
jgi:hypothetical protein